MDYLEETLQIENDARDRAFLLHFQGEENDVKKQFGLEYDGNPVIVMKHTGLFGILDALIDLGLTNREIISFYIHGHVEPYDDPEEFTNGIINIVWGMSKEEIENEYGRYFSKKTIERISNPNRNTQMLLSFCYSKDDTYLFIPNKKDLYYRFLEIYSSIRYGDYPSDISQGDFQEIDGKLFRAVRFLVRQGYDFPDLESLTNEQIKDITFKKANSEKTFVLNKDFARKISDIILSLVCFFKRENYKFLNPENMFNQQCDDIILIDSNGKQIVLNRAYLETDLHKYTNTIRLLNQQGFEIADIISLCDSRVQNIELEFTDNESQTHRLTIKRDKLSTISQEQIRIIKKAYNQGFTFPDSDNLFDTNQELLKVADSNGVEYMVIREQFDDMLDIIIKCRECDFEINLNQLFDVNQNDVELSDKQGRKAVVNRDRIIHTMNTFSLLTQNGYNFADYNSLVDEKHEYIIAYDEQNRERRLSRKQTNKIIRLQELTHKKGEDLTDKEKDLLLMLKNRYTLKRLLEWLPASKKWFPPSAVMMKIPAERSHEYFHNNNSSRLEELMKAYKPSNYEEMEGIVSLAYILGLFSQKGSASERALRFIFEHFLNKGVSADELHTTYGAIDLRSGYNSKFSEFFMQHYPLDSEAFTEPDLGTNMVGELFNRFDEVLESRPEKKIKTNTRRELLTPIDAMAAITSIQVDREILGKNADDNRYIRLIELLSKFGASQNELIWAINLYTQALAIDENKVKIPHIEDSSTSTMKFTSHLKSDPLAFISGRKTNCCSRYGGYAQDRLEHTITDPNWRYVTFTSSNQTYFDGLEWYDEKEKVVCIDNVEGRFSGTDKRRAESVEEMASAIIRYADGIYVRMRELGIPCKKVNVGKDRGTASWKVFNYANQQGLILDDTDPCNYPKRNGISTDAHSQFTITDEKVLSLRRKL